MKESIKRQRAGPVPRGDTQRKQDGRQEKPKQQEPVWTEKPSKKVGGGGLGKDTEGTADRGKIKKTFLGRREEPAIKEERDRPREKSPGLDRRLNWHGHR
mgnify:CR=1 FL=1